MILHPQIADLAKLEANWDSYGAVPIDPLCLEHASFFILAMPPSMWTPVPCSDGSVLLERHAGGVDMELHISRAQTVGAEHG
jgi:hypothetical protein